MKDTGIWHITTKIIAVTSMLTLFFACAEEESEMQNLPPENTIRFNIKEGFKPLTRALTASDNLTEVYVLAQKSSDNNFLNPSDVFGQTPLTLNLMPDGSCEYSPAQNWEDYCYRFRAFFPSNAFSYSDCNPTINGYNDSPTDATDMVVSDLETRKAGDRSNVSLYMKHILSKVSFSVKNIGNNSPVTINNISLTYCGKGDYDAGNADPWILPGNTASNNTIHTTKACTLSTSNSTADIEEFQDLLLIPQPLDRITCTVEYTVQKSSTDYPITSTVNLTGNGQISSWEANKSYHYTIGLYLLGAKANIYIEDWEYVNYEIDLNI